MPQPTIVKLYKEACFANGVVRTKDLVQIYYGLGLSVFKVNVIVLISEDVKVVWHLPGGP